MKIVLPREFSGREILKAFEKVAVSFEELSRNEELDSWSLRSIYENKMYEEIDFGDIMVSSRNRGGEWVTGGGDQRKLSSILETFQERFLSILQA